MNRLHRLVVGVLLVLLPLSAAGAARSADPQTLRIGVLAPLSGPYASGGSSFLQAVTLAAERANADGGVLGRRVEVAPADTQGRVEIARSETLRLVSREKVFALVGAYLSEETIGVIEVASAATVPVIVPVAATGEITDRVRRDYNRYRYVFRVGYAIPQWAGMMAEFLRARKTGRYAFVGANIRWNRELAAALRETLARAGVTPVYEAFYSPGNPAFEPVAVAALAAKPDMIVLGDPGKNSVAFLKRIREGDGGPPAFSVGGTLGDARIAASLPLSPPLYVQAAAWKGSSEAATRYAETFERRYGYPPVGYSDTLPYDALTVLLAAIRSAGRLDVESVIATLEKGAFAGVAGTYRFDRSHQAMWGGPLPTCTGPSFAGRRKGPGSCSPVPDPRVGPLPQVLLDGLFTGASYALMAAGLALILGVVKVVNLSHGAFFTLGAYVAYALHERGMGNPAAAALLAAAVAFAFGVFLGKSFINPVRSQPFSVAVGTLGAALLFEQVAQIAWGPHPLSIDGGRAVALVPGLTIRSWGLVSLVASSTLLGGIALLLSSRFGLPLKLISEDEEVAGSVGMDVEKIRYLTFGAASAVAAVAGVLLAPTGAIVPTMGRVPLILSLIVVIASGMDRIGAILLLGVGLGLLSNLSAYLLGPEWSYILLLAAISVLLVLRPQGLIAILPARDYR